jgi:hypothetical protein
MIPMIKAEWIVRRKYLRSETAPGVFSKKLAFTPFAVAHYCRVTARERIQTLAINALHASLYFYALGAPQSSSASRFTAGASGCFIFNQSGERPER